MKVDGNKIIADEGKEIYNISNPECYGSQIILGTNDSVENWSERKETIIEDLQWDIEK